MKPNDNNKKYQQQKAVHQTGSCLTILHIHYM